MGDQRIDLTRRKVLAGLSGVGVATVGAGLGSTAYFSDRETYPDNRLVAGELDLQVDWEEHYSDWSADENDDRTDDFGGDEFDADLDGDGVDDFDVVMTEGDPTAVPEGYTGFPTFEEPLVAVPDAAMDDFLDNTAVEAYPDEDDDGIQDLILTRDQISALNPTLSPEQVEQAFHDQFADVPQDLEAPVIELEDVKPGDFGEVTFSIHLHNNPGYLWMTGELLDAVENGQTEPEADDPDEQAEVVELLDEVQVAVWHDDGDNVREEVELVSSPHDVDQGTAITLDADESLIARGTLREVLDSLSSGVGVPIDADPTTEERVCFPFSTTRYFGFAWWLPVDHANEIQTDSATFDLGFYTEQCRHNDGSGITPECDVVSGSGWGKQTQFADGVETSFARARYGDNLASGAWELAIAEPSLPPTIDQANYVWTDGATVPFTYAYDGSTATFTLDGTTISGAIPEPRGKVGIQLKADESSISASNLTLANASGKTVASGQALAISEDNSEGGRGLAYLIYGGDCFDAATGFTLAGDLTLNLQDDYPGSDEGVAMDVIVE